MNYEINSNNILIKDTQEFLPKHILDCGQVFRYLNCNSGHKVFSKNSFCGLIYIQGCVTIDSDNPLEWANYFDLNRDYGAIKADLSGCFGTLDRAIEFGHGIRILNQDPYEMILSFIISANNNIPRIKGIIERLCARSGLKIGDDEFGFPSVEALKGKGEDFYKELGAGYRASYLVKTVDAMLNGFNLDISAMDTDTARRHLMKLTGVGRKVADCILLFGYHRTDVFPVDVWTERVYDDLFGKGDLTPEQKANRLCSYFGPLSGYAQQYLYYYYRENNLK
ncbi:MAG: 8-oxoguanine DNA glycosylase [Clostridia bacterium]|nr:8-oxoguanine DNA glycosylase [Clostridia bacterium]